MTNNLFRIVAAVAGCLLVHFAHAAEANFKDKVLQVLGSPSESEIGSVAFDQQVLQLLGDLGSRGALVESIIIRAEETGLATEMMFAHRHLCFIWRGQEEGHSLKIEIQVGLDVKLRPKYLVSTIKREAVERPPIEPIKASEPHKPTKAR